MPRITLAHWHGGSAPGAELEVSDEELAALQHDGRVASVLEDTAVEPETTDPSPALPEDRASDEAEPAGAGTDAAAEEPTPRTRKRR